MAVVGFALIFHIILIVSYFLTYCLCFCVCVCALPLTDWNFCNFVLLVNFATKTLLYIHAVVYFSLTYIN